MLIGPLWPELGGDMPRLCEPLFGDVATLLWLACGTFSGLGIAVPTDCWGARPALESA